MDFGFSCGGSCGGFGGSSMCGCAGSPGVLGVLVVLVSRWFYDCESVVSQPLSFSRKRPAFFMES